MIPRRPLLFGCLLALAWLTSAPGSEELGQKDGHAQDKAPHKNVLRRFGTVRFGAGDAILSLAYSPNGKIIASGGRNDPVRLWDAESGELIRELKDFWAWAVAFSPDGKTLATAGSFKVIHLWDVASGKEIAQLKGHDMTINALAFSEDGTRLVSGSDDGTVRLWKVAGERVTEGEVNRGPSGIYAVCISPDGKRFASGCVDHTIHVLEAGKDILLPMPAMVTGVAFMPDGKSLVAAGDDGFIRVWDIAAAKELRQWKADTIITHMALSEDGKTLATTGKDKMVRIWDVAKGTALHNLPGFTHAALALSRDGKQIATGGLHNGIRSFDATTGRLLGNRTPPAGAVTGVAYLPNGDLAAVGFSSNQISLLELATGKEQHRLVCGKEDADVLLALTEDGKTLATASTANGVILWDMATAKESKRIEVPKGTNVNCLALKPDGMSLAIGTDSGLLLVDPNAGTILKQMDLGVKIDEKTRPVRAVAFSRDGKTLAASSEGSIFLSETDNPAKLQPIPKFEDIVASLAFAPDGHTLAAGMFDGNISLIDLKPRKGKKTDPKPRMLEGHRGAVNALSWTVNCRCLASASFDGTVCIWEVGNGQPIAMWKGHGGEVTAVAFQAMGRTVLSGSADTTLLLWDVTGFGPGDKLPVKELDAPALEELWKELASKDNAKGNEAMWTLASAKDCANYLTRKVFLVDPQKIKQYIADLNADTFKVREKAYAALVSYERWIEGNLRETLKNPPSEEVRQRVALLLQRLSSVDAITLDQERQRARRVIEILEQVNTQPARELLAGMASGAAEEDLREMAAAALARASKR